MKNERAAELLGIYVYQSRVNKHKSQWEIVLNCRITEKDFISLEKGQFVPSDDVLVEIAQQVEVESHELLDLATRARPHSVY